MSDPSDGLSNFVNVMAHQFAERDRERTETERAAREALGCDGERWDRLVSAWRGLKATELETLWEFAAVASQLADEFGESALAHFARQVRWPEHMIRRSVEAFRARPIQPDAVSKLVFRTEGEFVKHVQKLLIARGFAVKREARAGSGRVDLEGSLREGSHRRIRFFVEAKLSSDWRAAAQALGQLLFYKGIIHKKYGALEGGLWFASPQRPDDDVLEVLREYEVRYFERG